MWCKSGDHLLASGVGILRLQRRIPPPDVSKWSSSSHLAPPYSGCFPLVSCHMSHIAPHRYHITVIKQIFVQVRCGGWQLIWIFVIGGFAFSQLQCTMVWLQVANGVVSVNVVITVGSWQRTMWANQYVYVAGCNINEWISSSRYETVTVWRRCYWIRHR